MHIKLKRNPFNYRRDLPHIQKSDKAHFITFTTYRRWELPSLARDLAMEALLFHDTAKMDVHAAIVMPDHAHLVCTLYWDRGGELIRLSELMQSIKGYSAFAIKKKLKMKGHVWLDESFDHVIRNFEGIDAKCDYLKMNPVRRGLVKDPLKYRWLYAEDMVDWNENMGEDNKPLPALKVWQKKWQA